MSGVVAVPAEAPGESTAASPWPWRTSRARSTCCCRWRSASWTSPRSPCRWSRTSFIQYVRALQEDTSQGPGPEGRRVPGGGRGHPAGPEGRPAAAARRGRGRVRRGAAEARDLLFARLLQYKAFKEVAGQLNVRFAAESVRIARQVDLDPRSPRPCPRSRGR
ncbi:hypothetical protein QJS66_05930 [Kocuria rhizophila]|nr:hypothetical protein QJS66_05930 [Kocuria rhizophila]